MAPELRATFKLKTAECEEGGEGGRGQAVGGDVPMCTRLDMENIRGRPERQNLMPPC